MAEVASAVEILKRYNDDKLGGHLQRLQEQAKTLNIALHDETAMKSKAK